MKRFSRRSKRPSPPDEGPSEPAYVAGHILTEAIHAEAPPATSQDPEDLERTADDQRQSALLRLPIEVRRRIYDDVFEEADLTQHVYVKNGRYTHAASITDHDAPDERQIEVGKIYPTTGRFLNHPVWSRRLLSSWANHWRCEEAAMAAAAEGPPAPTPFWSLLLCCKRTYLDCRQPLYERLTFVLHRVETALDFLSIPAIAHAIRSLQLSLQLDIRRRLIDREEVPAELPWHGRLSAWRRLRDRLPELENLCHLDLWLDAATHTARLILLIDKEAFDFDTRLVPFLRVSTPLDQLDNGRYYPVNVDPPENTLAGGVAEYWQEPDIAPDITWYPHYRPARLYERPEEYDSGRLHIRPRRLGFIESVYMLFSR